MSVFPIPIGLGLVATKNRIIRPGSEYDKYFDTSKLIRSDKVVLEGTNFQTLDQMASIVNKTLDDTKAISKILSGKSREETAKNIWQFLYDHIEYVTDDDEFEELRRPLRTWADRKGDCDCYAIFASSILTNLGIDHYFRMAGYNNGDYQHVYVVVPKTQGSTLASRADYFVIDPVLEQFDKEAPFSKKFDKSMKMPIKYLNGVVPSGNIDYSYNYPSGYEFQSLGKNGLGQSENARLIAEDFMARVKNHLINIQKNTTNESLKTQINNVLQAWESPLQRDAIISIYADNQTDTGSYDLILQVESDNRNLWQRVKSGIDRVGEAIGSGFSEVKEIAQKAGNDIVGDDILPVPTAETKNIKNWLLLGGLGLATILLVSGNKNGGRKKITGESQKVNRGVSGISKKRNAGTTPSRRTNSKSKKSVPTMVMS